MDTHTTAAAPRRRRGNALGGFLLGAAVTTALLNPLQWPVPWTPAVNHVIGMLERATAATPIKPPTPSLGLRQTPLGTPPPALRPGRDFAYITARNRPDIRWSCAVPIGVATAGTVPAGTQDALARAVTALVHASGLPLRTLPAGADDAAIVVRYQQEGTSAAG